LNVGIEKRQGTPKKRRRDLLRRHGYPAVGVSQKSEKNEGKGELSVTSTNRKRSTNGPKEILAFNRRKGLNRELNTRKGNKRRQGSRVKSMRHTLTNAKAVED